MEEHIGKRVNHERVEEALDTGASKIATGCPFCRVMITDGVDDVAAANDVPKAEVLDVAQLLLGSLDKSSVTLPEKGLAAKESEERAAYVAASTPTAEKTAPAEATRRHRQSPRLRPRPRLHRRHAGGNQAGDRSGYRRWGEAPWRKEGGGPRRRSTGRRSHRSPEHRPPRGWASRRAQSVPAPRRRARRGAPAPSPKRPLTAEPGHPRSRASVWRRVPGDPAPRRPRAPAAPAHPQAPRPKRRPAEAGPKPEARGEGTRHRPGARRPGAKKVPARQPKPAAPQPEPESDGESGAVPEPSAEGNGEKPCRPPVKGLGIARGARPPGKR